MLEIIKGKLNAHLLIWTSLFVLLITHASMHLEPLESIAKVGFILGLQAVVYYFHSEVVMPKLFEPKKYFLFALAVVGIVIFSSLIMHSAERFILPDEIKQMHFIIEHSESSEIGKKMLMRGKMMMHGASIFGILFISTVVSLATNRNKQEQESMKLENKVLEAESKFLKSQINPHFLFNALNNIYSLAHMKSDKAPDAIMKLSEMLRYVLYESDVDFVPLIKEITYLKGFIDLHLLKDNSISNVKYSFPDDITGAVVAPLIMLPFVENAFKHSGYEDTRNGWISIELFLKKRELRLLVANSIVKKNGQKDRLGGVGLENVKNRLAILYKNRHNLKIEEKEDSYSIELTIDLNEA